jgi:GLPGLI family protein
MVLSIMTRLKQIWTFTGFILLPFLAFPQKRVGDLTIVYNATITNTQDSAKKINSTTSHFLKGNLSRSETNSSMFSSTTIYDSKSGSGVILREVNGQKLLIRMNEENWNQKNKRYQNLNFTRTNETKTIAGYSCSQAKASTADGFEITVYYTRDLVPENKAYDPPFKNLEGLPLEYEMTRGNLHIRYTLASINLNPVPASKFDIPLKGYRELTYDESLKMKSP